jgi:hypothetical protein
MGNCATGIIVESEVKWLRMVEDWERGWGTDTSLQSFAQLSGDQRRRAHRTGGITARQGKQRGGAVEERTGAERSSPVKHQEAQPVPCPRARKGVPA